MSHAGYSTINCRRAAEGEYLLEAATMARLLEQRKASQVKGTGQTRIDHELDGREKEVLALMARGLDNAGIATELGVGLGTIRSSVRSMLAKLGAHSRAQAIANARRAGIVSG